MIQGITSTRYYRVGHLACGIGAGAKGFNDANPRVGHMSAKFVCAGGIDVDAGAIRNFDRITGAKGTVKDLFDEEQYLAFHGKAPPADWRAAHPADIRAALGEMLDVIFASLPCKGFSGLLSAKASETAKYQALNRLTLRTIWLALEAYKDSPVRIILFENVPRIATRGRHLLAQIKALLRQYGYVVTEDDHDCGEIGGLAQSRKRFLLIARHAALVPNFTYMPHRVPLRGVGEVIGKLPLPGDPRAGTMHRVPMLQWKTWVRLAFVEAGKDWRSLNNLRVENGVLADYGIVPEQPLRDNALGVLGWEETAPTLTSQRSPGQGRFSVADPRPNEMHSAAYGVLGFEQTSGAVIGESLPSNGRFAVADPRPEGADWNSDVLGVRNWADSTGTVAGRSSPTNGSYSVADPRPPQDGNQTYQQYGVNGWDDPTGAVPAQSGPGSGSHSVADPRLGRKAYSNIYRIIAFDETATAVTSSRDVAVADPRPAERDDGYKQIKYKVTAYDAAAGTVIGASTTGNGAFAVADPRPTHGPQAHHNKMRVVDAQAPAPTITGSDRVGSGALSVADPRPSYGADTHKNVLRVTDWDRAAGTVTSGHGPSNGAISVADPRPVCLNAEGREGYATQGHYGVVPWDEPTGAVPAYAKNNNGSWSVADPRDAAMEPAESLPAPNERLICRIVARDGTWHRPFTTLELAALQSLFDPGEIFDLEGGSDQMKREWIGNAVPSASARGMAETIGECLLLADMGETFMLSTREIWVKPLALALSVDPTAQPNWEDA